MRSYCIERRPNGRVICYREEPRPNGVVRQLLPHVVRHSPDGFEIGYGGSGPADLALSILSDFAPTALDAYQAFKWAFLQDALPPGAWRIIRGEDIQAWFERREAEKS